MEKYKQPPNNQMSTIYNPVIVHCVLKNGNRREIRELLQCKIDLNCISENGDTVLHAVLRNEKLIERNLIGFLDFFLNKGIDPNIVNNDEETILHLAIEKRKKDNMDFLLTSGANIHALDKHGNSIPNFFIEDEYEKYKMAMNHPIMNTVQSRQIMEKNSISFLEFLISKIDFDVKNEQGESALHVAIKYQLLHILPTLFEHTNDIGFISKDNKTLLHLFLEAKSQLPNEHSHSGNYSSHAARCVKILLDRGLPVLACDKYNCRLLSNAFKMREETDIIEALVDYYLENCDNKDLATTLFYELIDSCISWNNLDLNYFLTVLLDLLNKSANVNRELQQKRCALIEKVTGNLTFISFLKRIGIDCNIRSRHSNSLLYLLAQQRDCEGPHDELYNQIRDLVTSGESDVDVRYDGGKSVLQTAISSGNVPMIPILIELGADVNIRDDMMRTPLHDAVLMNEAVNVVRWLILKEADVSAEDQASETPLHLAVSKNNLAVVQLLIQNGASVNHRNKHQQTPLHRALLKKKLAADVVDLLLFNGAEVNARDRTAETPLHLAVSHQDVAIVRSLLQHGASVDCKDEFQQTPLHRALPMKNVVDVEMVELLLTSGADVNAKNYKGETPLHAAVCINNAAIVRSLVERGATVDCEDKYRQTPLHRALANAGMGTIDLLLSSGANPNAKDSNGETPLHMAIPRNNSAIVRLLIEAGAFVNCEGLHRQTPLHRALAVAGVKTIDLLLSSGADPNAEDSQGETPIHMAISRNNVTIVQSLIEYGASVHCRDKYQQTPLYRAVNNENMKIVKLLITCGADLNASDYKDVTPLHVAVSKNNLWIVQLLVEKGASVRCKDKYRQTALHRALLKKIMVKVEIQIVGSLLKYGSKVNARDCAGNRPLHCILKEPESFFSFHVVWMLLEKGAYVNARNNQGESPLFWALDCGVYGRPIDELLKYDVDLDDPKVQQLLADGRYESQRVWWEYLFKLQTTDFRLTEEYTNYIHRNYIRCYDEERHAECLREIEELKSTFISERKSLYDFLRMHPTRRRSCMNEQQLQQLVESPVLNEQFPEYSSIILSSYRGVVRRRFLLKAAEEALYAMTQDRLSDVVDQILEYLAEHDLISIVEANGDDDTVDNK